MDKNMNNDLSKADPLPNYKIYKFTTCKCSIGYPYHWQQGNLIILIAIYFKKKDNYLLHKYVFTDLLFVSKP